MRTPSREAEGEISKDAVGRSFSTLCRFQCPRGTDRATGGHRKVALAFARDILLLGGLAQLGERLLCKQEVSGSSPLISTTLGR